MTQFAFFFDQTRCYSCHTCSVACKTKQGHGPGPVKWLRIYDWETGAFPDTQLHSLFVPCYHCEHPKCVEACKTGALYKEEKWGAVLQDLSKCVGCHECNHACDFGAPACDDAPPAPMTKCDMCIDRLEQGLYPLCVLSCPMRALDFGTFDQMKEKYPDGVNLLPEMPQTDSGPSIWIRPQSEKKQIVAFDSAKCLELMGDRADLPTFYEDASEVKDIPDGFIRRDKLNWKAKSIDEFMEFTSNYEA